MKLETENLILYPLTKSLIQQILNDEVTDYSTKEWLTEDNRTLLTWMYEELYAFIPPKMGFTSWIFIEKLTNQVIGDGGYKGNPDTRGQIEIGYEIIESKRQKESIRSFLLQKISEGMSPRKIKEGVFLQSRTNRPQFPFLKQSSRCA